MKKIGLVFIGILVAILGLNIALNLTGNSNETFEIEGNKFSSINVKTDNSKIEIQPTNSKEAKVELVGGSKNYKLDAKVKGKTLEVKIKRKWFARIGFNFSLKGQTLKLYLPEKSYSKVVLATDNGSIHVNDIVAEVFEGKTDNGRINLNNMISDSINVRTDNGRIEMADVEGAIKGKTDNGSISLFTTTLDRPIDLKTDNGPVVIQTDSHPSNVTFDLRTDIGRVTVFGDSDYERVVGKGDNLIKIKTDNGSIKIEQQ